MDAWGGKANIIIVSDHGFRRATEEKMENPKSGIDYLSGDHRPNGILLATGPDIQPGEIEGITIMEIAPTLAALMGLPIAGDLPGNIAVDLLRPDAFKDRPLQSVSDYSHVPMPHLGMKPNEAVQEEEMEALRGLGYVGEGVTFDSESAAGEYDFWTTDADLLSGHIGGEIIYYLSQGDTDLAEEAYAEILEHRPDAAARAIRFSQAHFKRLMEGLPEGALDPAPFEAFFEAHSR
jgi:hypothetical protein